MSRRVAAPVRLFPMRFLSDVDKVTKQFTSKCLIVNNKGMSSVKEKGLDERRMASCVAALAAS